MHKLERGSAPACLNNYRHGEHGWQKVSSRHKNAIWTELYKMQGQRCAYCEAALSAGKHIEHFRQRSRYPEGTFAWDNLFGSCNRENSCGKHKDRCGDYPHGDLLKPDRDDPEDFLIFVADGSVQPRDGLSETDQRRARETIRIFNLNGELKQMRSARLRGYNHIAEEIVAHLDVLGLEQAEQYLQDEIEKTKDQPFATAIRHFLCAHL